jgi:hypothetical protein
MTVLYAESGAGKTFVAVDMACRIATGMPWRGKDVEQGIVVYVAAEAPSSVQRRIYAWRQRHEVEKLPVFVVHSTINLLGPDDTGALTGQIKAIIESRGPVRLIIIIDTLARVMVGNENAPGDMGKFVGACDRIRETTGSHVMVVHHSGKDVARGARGHSSLRAGTDVEMEITKADSTGCIRIGKNRDEGDESTFGFKLEVVELGVNSKGRMVTTCVAAEVDAVPGDRNKASKPRLPTSAKIVIDALKAALTYKGQRPPAHEETRGVDRAVIVEDRRLYHRQVTGYSDDDKGKETERKAWTRGKEAALAAGAVRVWGGWVWLV